MIVREIIDNHIYSGVTLEQVFERLNGDERLEVIGSYLNWPIMLMAAWKMQVEPETAPIIHTLLYLVETLLILSWKLRKRW